MLNPRVIPCLMVRGGALTKTVEFESARYVGDPLNAVRILNEKGVDELVVLDIGSTVDDTGIDLDLVQHLASECRMPLCYGGGVQSVQQALDIVRIGVEKVAISAAAIAEPKLISAIARSIGSQSVVIALDIRTGEHPDGYEVWTHNGRKPTGLSPMDLASSAEQAGAGEILINSIDRDGATIGYDLHLARMVRESVSLPMTVLGGAGSLGDMRALIEEMGIVGAAAGSMFVFKGPHRAVLITYPGEKEREALWSGASGSASGPDSGSC